MLSKKMLALAILAGGALAIAALTLDVDIRVKDAWAQPAGPSPVEWSPTGPYPKHGVYYPGTEALAPDEMRVVACGTGMPQPRRG